jgi:hypothetical protein
MGIVLSTFLFAQNPGLGIDRVVVYKHERKLVLLSPRPIEIKP